jgi:hypothetical protein
VRGTPSASLAVATMGIVPMVFMVTWASPLASSVTLVPFTVSVMLVTATSSLARRI